MAEPTLTGFHHHPLALTSSASAYLLTEVAVANMTQRQFVSLGMFIVDHFSFEDEDGNPTGRNLEPQVCLCGHCGDPFPHPTCVLAAYPPLSDLNPDRRWRNLCCYRSQDLVSDRYTKTRCLCDLIVAWSRRLDPTDIGMVVDRGRDFPSHIQAKLDSYGSDMWLFRDDPTRGTTKALNYYRGDYRGFVNRNFFIYNV
jgi:hypothetical protein